MNEPAAFQKIVDSFSLLDDWDDRFRYIIELGQALPRLGEAEKSDANRVHGCVSQVWLVLEVERRDGRDLLTYRGESDSMIVQGLVALLLELYSGRSPAEIADTDAIALFDRLGLREHLTTQRSNGLLAMASRIRAEGRRHAGID